MEESSVSDPAISTAEWIAVIGVEIVASIVVAIGLALLMRALFTRRPHLRLVMHLLPWRSAVALTMIYVSPLPLVLNGYDSFWRLFFNALLDQGGLESLGWFCIGVWSSLIALTMTTAVLVQHWVPDSLPNHCARTLRTVAVVIVAFAIEIQTETVLGDGLGGALARAYSEFDKAGAATAWRRIVMTLCSVDILFGAIQIAVRVVAQRVFRARASTLTNEKDNIEKDVEKAIAGGSI